jgi:hypothetical protein
MKVRLIDDDTGWTVVFETEHDDSGGASIAVPFVDYERVGCGATISQMIYWRSGERDVDGCTIFRTRKQ